jgi:hypothetical protein
MRVGPHQGALIRLPDEKGLAELITEPNERELRGAEPTAFVVYFLRPDGKSPLDPVPSNASLVVEQARKAAQTVQLSLDPRTDDPVGGTRFASKPGPYQLARLTGTLKANIGGQEVSAPFSGGSGAR